MSVEVDYRSKRFWIVKDGKRFNPKLTEAEQASIIDKFVHDTDNAIFSGLNHQTDKIPEGLIDIITH